MAQALKGVYRPRNPQSTSFYQLVEEHGERLKNVYPDRYEHQFGYYRPIAQEVFFRYLDCGILRYGFARIRCEHCHNEYLLAFSCKTRAFCPSCHAKRSVVFSEWVCKEVMEPVTHRHYVFSIPKILRTYFRYNRRLLGALSRCAYETVKEMMQAVMEDNTITPGMIVAIQTFGSSDIHWHPHLHCLVTNGGFDKDGTFHPMEILLPSAIIEVFQHKVFRMLLKEGLITKERVKMILSWRHFSLRSMQALPGFHVHNEGKVVANDTEGRERLARYLIRPPVSLERLTYDRENQQVYYKGKAETHTYQPLDFLAYVSLHIPNKGEQIVRYYGWYSNKSRGLRKAVLALSEAKKEKPASPAISPALNDLTHYQKKCRSAWARLIRKIYEVDPLLCPRCKHPMKIVAFIEDDSTIQKILKHLGLWETRSHSPPPSSIICEEIVYVDESSTPVPASA